MSNAVISRRTIRDPDSPATEPQKRFLDQLSVIFPAGITKLEAAKAIRKALEEQRK